MPVSFAVFARVLVLLAVLLFGSTAHAFAQERRPSLPRGEPVRITSSLLPGRAVVVFEEFRGDTLLAVRASGEPLRLPLSQIDELETAGKDRVTGALAGAGVGAVALTLGLGLYAHSRGGFLDCHGCPLSDDLGIAAFFGVPVGGIIGGIIGSIVGVRRWDPVPGPIGRP
jgi:hypothetical protein